MTQFTWQTFFNEMLSKILADYDKHSLAKLALEIFGSSNFNDKFKDGSNGLIKEIDPLTFIGFFNRNQTEANRIQFCKIAKSRLGLIEEVPNDFNGIPIINAQKSWFFPFEKERRLDDIDSLWEFARKLSDSKLDASIFKRCLAIKNVKEAKLTQLAFIVRPNSYFPLDKFNLEFLEKCGVTENKERLSPMFEFDEYIATLDRLKQKFPNISFAELSHKAKEEVDRDELRYWVVGATWGTGEKVIDKSNEFILNHEWICGYESEDEGNHANKVVDKVRAILPGDFIAMKSRWSNFGITVKAVGEVVGVIEEGRHLKVDWKFTGPSFNLKGVHYIQTIHSVTDPMDIFLIFLNSYKSAEKNTSQNKISSEINMTPKNLILYGPPGTGKTFSTIARAISIANPNFNLNSSSRTKIKEEFERLRKSKQIIFTTFHQSLSYEDFIEGIKPVQNENEKSIRYDVVPGIFRQICIDAAFSIATSRGVQSTKESLNLSHAYDLFVESIENGEVSELKTKSGQDLSITVNDNGNLELRHRDGVNTYTVSKKRLLDLHLGLNKDMGEVKNIHKEFRDIIGGSNATAFWAVLHHLRNNINIVKNDETEEHSSYDEKKRITSNLTQEDYQRASAKPFVLIIDEINRGNISQIFGELITLIENDKRLGSEEYLTATLPYSKDDFGVPPNVFIIGTMNTADRSVEALDIALRRRFVFEEIPPLPNLKELEEKKLEINLSKLLTTINERLEKLLNKDHLIGHSYFLAVNDLAGLKEVFHKNIFPLLQEYFYGDLGRAGLVVGSGFLIPSDSNNGIKFADFDDYSSEDWNDKKVYRFKNPTKMSDNDFINAINKLMGVNE